LRDAFNACVFVAHLRAPLSLLRNCGSGSCVTVGAHLVGGVDNIALAQFGAFEQYRRSEFCGNAQPWQQVIGQLTRIT
jgi:hypothetical protein